MTRMECVRLINTHKDLYYEGSLIDGRGVFPVLVFFKSPVTGAVECRQGFFVEASEASIWAEELKKVYREMGVPFYLYLNGQLEDSQETLLNEM